MVVVLLLAEPVEAGRDAGVYEDTWLDVPPEQRTVGNGPLVVAEVLVFVVAARALNVVRALYIDRAAMLVLVLKTGLDGVMYPQLDVVFWFVAPRDAAAQGFRLVAAQVPRAPHLDAVAATDEVDLWPVDSLVYVDVALARTVSACGSRCRKCAPLRWTV